MFFSSQGQVPGLPQVDRIAIFLYNATTMDLFDHARKEQIEREAPLAARMRPRTLDEFVGQEHIVGPGRLLRRAIQADQLSSRHLLRAAGHGQDDPGRGHRQHHPQPL